jgi:hypothetical protein
MTDVLTVGIDSVPVGLCLNPAVPEARAAWYSFGFLLRRAAAVQLDVSESELDVGIQPVTDFNSPFTPPTAKVFLSDSLENGAGYSTFLGDPVRFDDLIRFIVGQNGSPPDVTFYQPMVSSPHETDCLSSCHRCLREYGNMAYHSILDWRLGLDLAYLALDSNTPITLDAPHWNSFLARIAAPYFIGLDLTPATFAGLPAGITTNNEAVILIHPLWDTNPANYHPDLAAAVQEAQRAGLSPIPKSLFRVVRFPYE